MKIWRGIGIEPNEHQIPRFLEKYSYHTDLPENPESPNSPYASVFLRVRQGGSQYTCADENFICGALSDFSIRHARGSRGGET